MKAPPKSIDALTAVWPATIASGALVAQHVAGKATRDTLFLTHFGLKALPAAMIGAALVSSVAVIGISRALGKYGPARLVPAMFAASATLFLLEWWLCLHSEQGATVAVYVHTALVGSAGVSAFWSLVNERFDPHTAKRIVGRIASGGTVGGVLGGLVVWRAAAHLSVPQMLALLAAINVIGLLGAARIGGGSAQGAEKHAEPVVGGGLQAVRETPYLRDLALLVLVGAIVQALLDWLLSAHATRTYGKGPELLGFFALFNMIVGVLSFAAQTGLTRPSLERLGLARTAALQPLTVAATGVVALLSPHLWSIVALRTGEAVMRNSLYRSAYELFYTPLPTAKKRATKTLIDVGVDRIGTTMGSLALVVAAQLSPDLATRAVLIAAITMAAGAWLISVRLHDGYVSALAASLKSGALALEDDDATDFTTKKTLAETTALLDRDQLLARIEQFQKSKGAAEGRLAEGPAPEGEAASAGKEGASPTLDVTSDPLVARAAMLRSGDVARTKAALTAPLTASLVSFAIPLLANDPVARDAVRALRKIAPKATGQLLDALLDHDVDPHVRRRIPRVLKACRTQRAATGLLMALSDPEFAVRVQVALALSELLAAKELVVPRDQVFDIVLHEVTAGRATWNETPTGEDNVDQGDKLASGDALGAPYRESGDAATTNKNQDGIARGLAHVFMVLGLVLEREPLAIAHRALRAEDPSLRGTAHEYLEVVLPARLREVVIPLLGDVKRMARSRERGSKELAEELLRSSASLTRPSS